VLGSLVLHDAWHNSGEGFKATHSVVVAFFVDGVMVDDNWNVFVHDPFILELLGEDGTLIDSRISNAGSGVSEVSHEGSLQIFDIAIFSEMDCKLSNKIKDVHSSSPLSILCHISKSVQKWCRKEILTNNFSNLR